VRGQVEGSERRRRRGNKSQTSERERRKNPANLNFIFIRKRIYTLLAMKNIFMMKLYNETQRYTRSR
jgi:hypothetical protein